MCPARLNLLPLITLAISVSPNRSLISWCVFFSKRHLPLFDYIFRVVIYFQINIDEHNIFILLFYLFRLVSSHSDKTGYKMDNMRQRDKTSPFKIRISVFLVYQVYDVVLRFANKSQETSILENLTKQIVIWNTINKKTKRAQTRYATYSETRDRLCSSISESSALSKTLDPISQALTKYFWNVSWIAGRWQTEWM